MVDYPTHMNNQIPPRFAVTRKIKPFLFNIIIVSAPCHKRHRQPLLSNSRIQQPVNWLCRCMARTETLELEGVIGSFCSYDLINRCGYAQN